MLDRAVRAHLKSLPRAAADEVARHLVMVGQLIDDDPEKAYLHAQAALALGARLAVVREAAGLAAYRAGEFTAALSELRAHRRMSGSESHLPVLADCERALGRPQAALELSNTPGLDRLPIASQVEMRIVASGARRDLGQADAAVVVLQGKFLDETSLSEWTPRLWYAYADALLGAGRESDAREWFEAVAQIDDDGWTDAAERLLELDGITIDDGLLETVETDDDDEAVEPDESAVDPATASEDSAVAPEGTAPASGARDEDDSTLF